MIEKNTRRNFLRTVGATALTVPTLSTGTSAASADFAWPVSGQITSDYGGRYLDGEYDFHGGIDIGGDPETPIYAARSGTAYVADYPGSYGQMVYVEHENGYRTEYGHVNSYNVYDGEYVSRGEQIAGMGSEGHSTGVHLHLTIQRNDDTLSIPGSVGDYVSQGNAIPKDYSGIGGSSGNYSWQPYTRGDTGEAVYSIQYLLDHHGYDLAHDGSYGPETESTIESFQSANGLTVDGMTGPNTWSELIVYVTSEDNDPYWPTYAVQHHLNNDEGFSIAMDGVYGPETEDAIESFQSSAGITVDGMAGPNTWQALVDIGN